MIHDLQHMIQFIDSNVAVPLCLEEIAEAIGYSRYYLNHVFYTYTGYSIMEYVRIRKLEYALTELKRPRRVMDVALEIGYSSERAFTRAVVSEFGHSPSWFKTAGDPTQACGHHP